jgi:hypothetical protein
VYNKRQKAYYQKTVLIPHFTNHPIAKLFCLDDYNMKEIEKIKRESFEIKNLLCI